MGIIFGCVTPHPPLLVPEVGRGQERGISATTGAMEKLVSKLRELEPQALVVISPHGSSHQEAMGILTAASSSGDMSQWGSRGPKQYFDNDLQMVDLIKEEAETAAIPLASIGRTEYALDHGVMVPLHFLAGAAPGVPLVPLTFSWLPLEKHFEFGQVISRASEKSGRRVAVIASGDLSHRLLPGAPAGYDSLGKVFDRKLIEALSSWDVSAVLNMEAALIERAGECGLRSIVILLGALNKLNIKPEILSYEGPFGVGYLVASFEISTNAASKNKVLKNEKKPSPLVKLARDAVESYIKTGKLPPIKELTPAMKEKAGVFVSLKKQGDLRGCIGTFEPTRDNVAEEIMANAVSSATRDPRFSPVTKEELDTLEYSVDILTSPEPVKNTDELDPKKYGVIVESGYRRGLLLPDLEGVASVAEQIAICRAKAGILPDEPVKLYRFQVRRYK